jgi:hypothetical protein
MGQKTCDKVTFKYFARAGFPLSDAHCFRSAVRRKRAKGQRKTRYTEHTHAHKYTPTPRRLRRRWYATIKVQGYLCSNIPGFSPGYLMLRARPSLPSLLRRVFEIARILAQLLNAYSYIQFSSRMGLPPAL